ncbi:MAG: hypothetical protein E3J21_20755 [Anaerolineales bacterium]|nr:MAG: hypothetical protein E3J21_20755 [Anaerolineales bacterium]
MAPTREIMGTVTPAGPMYQAGTLSGNPLTMTAGLITLTRASSTLSRRQRRVSRSARRACVRPLLPERRFQGRRRRAMKEA